MSEKRRIASFDGRLTLFGGQGSLSALKRKSFHPIAQENEPDDNQTERIGFLIWHDRHSLLHAVFVCHGVLSCILHRSSTSIFYKCFNRSRDPSIRCEP